MGRKRSYGQGTVYSYVTPAGTTFYRWQVSLPKDPSNPSAGNQRFSEGGFKTSREAEKSKRLAITESENGRTRITESPMFEHYAKSWLASQKIANSTRMGYEKILRVHLIPEFGKQKLSAISATAIASFYRKLEKSGSKSRYTPGQPLSANTVNKIHIVLGAVLQTALEENKLTFNPARHNRKLVNAPTGADILNQQDELQTWSAEELSEFLFWNAESRDDLFPMWQMFAWSGMRRGEGVALKWQDLNFKNDTISIRRSSDSALRKTVKNSTKTKKNRSIAMDAQAMSILWGHKANRALIGAQLVSPDSFVFGNIDGTVRNPGDVGERFARTVKKAQKELPNLPHLTIKGLRHTHATLMLEAGIHAKVVQERLGHSNITTTMNIYSHVTPTMQEDAVNRLLRYVLSHESPYLEETDKTDRKHNELHI